MGELPAGTVTFLFTDIEGSTRLWEEHPEAMQGALARHDELLRRAVDAHGGTTVKATGDGIHAAFPTANDALGAAIDMQHDLAAESFGEPGPLRVRMGAHTCEAELRDGDYYGSGLNRAARLMSVAHGGQIVVSAVTAGLCDDAFTLVDLGEHRLRDLSRGEHVWQVDLDGERFPALRSLDNIPGNLPVQLTEFVGRADDVAQVAKALDAHRVVTLTGVGGVGKTRLALQVAAEFADRFHHGTWFCDLAPVASPDRVVHAIADALGIDAGAVDPDEVLASWLRHQRALLVIDNCEHLLDEAARVAEHLLRSCPDIVVLATSREGLGAPGEQIVAVRSLALPAADDGAGTVVETESVRLFVDRARSVRADLRLDDATVTAIGDICRRLDGIPLAIELAAARMQSMSAAEIDERLDQRFRLLTRGSRVALGRQHTLQTTVDWSYQLLDDAERTVLARASVFAGGFTLGAAERVVTTDDVDRFDVLDLLDSLVRRSMLVADERDGTTRYRLLETIRQFGAERLEETGDAEAARVAHLTWCREFMAEASAGLCGLDGRAWVGRLDRELDNWRAATATAIEIADLDALAELFGSIRPHALYGTRAGSAFAAAAVEALPAVTTDAAADHPAMAALLALAGYEQYLRADYAGAVATAQRGQQIARAGELPMPSLPNGFVYAAAYFGIDFETALDAAEEHVRIGRVTDDRYTKIEGSGMRAMALATLGRHEEALDEVAGIADIARDGDEPLLALHASFMTGFTYVTAGGDAELGNSMLQRAAELATTLENPFFATAALGWVAQFDREGSSATRLRDALELLRALPHRDVARGQLMQVSRVLILLGRYESAAVLFGARSQGAGRHHQTFSGRIEETERALVDALGEQRADELQNEGLRLTVDEVLDLAIAELDAVIADPQA
jgi:predicted ATPase/class 3 adenylate cyclase